MGSSTVLAVLQEYVVYALSVELLQLVPSYVAY